MRGRAVATGLAAAAALALTGCSGGHGDLDAADSPIARYDWDGGDAMAAALEGTLELREGCLLVYQSNDPGPPIVAVFPREHTSWTADAEILRYGGHNFHMADLIMAGGGFGTTVPENAMPAACLPFIDEQVGVFYIQTESIEPPTL